MDQHDICSICSALVNNLQAHVAWHRKLEGQMSAKAQEAVKDDQAQQYRKALGERPE